MDSKMKKLVIAVAGLLVVPFAFGTPRGSRSSTAFVNPPVVPSTAANEVSEIVKVRGKGTGTNKKEALKDAYRDAVENAVGLYVDAEQMMKNEELVKDQILTQSNAYIEKYEIVKENAKANGLVELLILAEVRKVALTKKISDVMTSKTFRLDSSKTQNVHARLVTEEKRGEDGAALMKNALEGIDPVKQLVKATLVSPEAEIVSGGGRGITLSYAFRFEIDQDRYMTELLPHIQKTFEQISTTPPKTIRLTSKRERNGDITFNGYAGDVIIDTRTATGVWSSPNGFSSVLLLTECNVNSAKARLYGLSEPVGKVLAEWQTNLLKDSITYNVIVRSKDESEICVVPLRFKYGELLPIVGYGKGKSGGWAIIAPLFCARKMTLCKVVNCKIPKDELPNVASITIELAD